MTAIIIMSLAALVIHLAWLRQKRGALLPPVGSRWIYGSYLSTYKVEVVGHHPLSGEIMIRRTKIGDAMSVGTTIRVNARAFLSSARPFNEQVG